MITKLPSDAVPYKRTQTFCESDVPSGLLDDHSTKEGTWGVIVVEEGQLSYIVDDERRERSERILSRGAAPGIVEPTIKHRVSPVGRVRFYVQFYRRPGA